MDQLINDNTLVALALLVAESKPDQMELMVKLVQHFVLLKDEAFDLLSPIATVAPF